MRILTVCLLGLILAACGGEAAPPTANTSEAAPQFDARITVDGREVKFTRVSASWKKDEDTVVFTFRTDAPEPGTPEEMDTTPMPPVASLSLELADRQKGLSVGNVTEARLLATDCPAPGSHLIENDVLAGLKGLSGKAVAGYTLMLQFEWQTDGKSMVVNVNSKLQ